MLKHTTDRAKASELYRAFYEMQPIKFLQASWDWAHNWMFLAEEPYIIYDGDLSTFIPLMKLKKPERGCDYVMLGEYDCDVRPWAFTGDLLELAHHLPVKSGMDLLHHEQVNSDIIHSFDKPIPTSNHGIYPEIYPIFSGSEEYFYTNKTKWEDFTAGWKHKKRYNINRDVAKLIEDYKVEQVKMTDIVLKAFKRLNRKKYGKYFRFAPEFKDREVLEQVWLTNNMDGFHVDEYTFQGSVVGYSITLYTPTSLVIWGSAMDPDHPSLNKLYYRRCFSIAEALDIPYLTPLSIDHNWKSQWQFDSMPNFNLSNTYYLDYFE